MTNIDDLKDLSAARRWAKTGTARTIRERAELTQAEIAEACDVDQSTVALWETGQRTPSGQPAKDYARILASVGSGLPGGILAVEGEVTGQWPVREGGKGEGFSIPLIEDIGYGEDIGRNWEATGRDGDGNLLLKHRDTGGLYRVLPIEEL